MKPAQVRMARAALNWSLGDLAAAAGVHRNTISNFETGRYAGTEEALNAMRRALEAAGVIFVEENGEGPGVRLKKQPCAPAQLDKKIDALDKKLAAIDVEGEPSPKKALNQMKKAIVENEKTKLENKRARMRRKDTP